MLNGTAPRECCRCIEDEKTGIKSKRQRSERLWAETDPPSSVIANVAELIHLEVNLGNLCNLRCITCQPLDSSAWNRDSKVAGYDPSPVTKLDPKILIPYCSSLQRVDLIGGETLLSTALEDTLNILIRHGNPKNILLTLVTNATVFPSERIRELIGNFGHIEITCSVDAFGRRNEYIRHPSKWEDIEKNLISFLKWKNQNPNMVVQITNTVSAYSFPGLPDLLRWWQIFVPEHSNQRAEKCLWLNPLLDPNFQSVHVLPRGVRERIVAELNSLQPAMANKLEALTRFALAKDETHFLPKLREWTSSLDRARGLNGREDVPEIFEEEQAVVNGD